MASEMFSKSVEYYMATIAWTKRGIKDLKLTPNVVQKLCNCHFLVANKKMAYFDCPHQDQASFRMTELHEC